MDVEAAQALAWFLLRVYLGTAWGFVAISHAKKLIDNAELGLFWRVHLYPLAAIFYFLDVAFNALLGSLFFFEFPRELLFTSRCKRHYRACGWRGGMARFWARQLNEIDPGHVS